MKILILQIPLYFSYEIKIVKNFNGIIFVEISIHIRSEKNIIFPTFRKKYQITKSTLKDGIQKSFQWKLQRSIVGLMIICCHFNCQGTQFSFQVTQDAEKCHTKCLRYDLLLIRHSPVVQAWWERAMHWRMGKRAKSGLWIHHFHPPVHTALHIKPVCLH